MPYNMYISSRLPQKKTTRMVGYNFINDSVTCNTEVKLLETQEKYWLFTIIE